MQAPAQNCRSFGARKITPDRAICALMSGVGRVRYRSAACDSARWERFSLRPGDIIISTPAKSGTTWMQMICALLIFQRTTFYRPLDLMSPWLDMQTRDIDDVTADLEEQQHRRFIKTHTPFDGLPDEANVTYICVGRDPRDVALSWANHEDNSDLNAFLGAREKAVGLDDLAELYENWTPPSIAPDDTRGRFWAWVEDTPPLELAASSLTLTMHHLRTFWEVRDRPNIILVHYADLQQNLEGEIRRLAERLGIALVEDRVSELVAAARFDAMRARADELAPGTAQGIWQNNRQFFRAGQTGQWQALLDDEKRRRYDARVRQLAAPELIEWAHHGRR